MCGYWHCCSNPTSNKAFCAMELPMKGFNSQLSGTRSHCQGLCLVVTRPPRGLGQMVLRLKPGLFPPSWHFCFWRAGITIKSPSACPGQYNLKLSSIAVMLEAHQSLFLEKSPLSPSTGRSEGQDGQAGIFLLPAGKF